MVAVIDQIPSLVKIKHPGDPWWIVDWNTIDDPSTEKFNLIKKQEVAYKIELPETTVSISKIVLDFTLTPVGTPTSRSLRVEMYEEDPTGGFIQEPFSYSTDTTVYTTVRNVHVEMQSHTVVGRTFYVVIYDTTEPNTAYYQLSFLKTKSTVEEASKPSVSIIAPRNQPMQGENQITFSWSYSGSENLSLSELDWSTNGANWTTIDHNISGTSKDVNPMTFPRGNIYWRVRSKSIYNVWSDYTTAQFTVQYSAQSTVSPINSPTSGFIPAETETAFSIQIESTGPVRPPFELTAATLYWRYGQSGAYTPAAMTIASDGLTANVSLSFSEGTVQWYAAGTDDNSPQKTSETDVFTLSVLNAEVVVTAVKPIGTVENAATQIEFEWAYYSLDESEQASAILEYSTDGETWTQFGSVDDSTKTYTAEPGTLPGGTVYWRVTATSMGGDESPPSVPVSLIILGAPVVQRVGVTARPFAIVTWETDDQQTYEIFVDGESLGSFFGPEKQYELPDYLRDGDHTIGVRVMGSFSLWSNIVSAHVSIENQEENHISLSAKTNVDVELDWGQESGEFYIYRDDVLIAKTHRSAFIDRVALGAHDYHVVRRLNSGYYDSSQTVTRTPSVLCNHVARLDGGEWIDIQYKLKSHSDSYQKSQEIEYNFLSRNDYPVASIGNHKTDVGSYSAVFLYTEKEKDEKFRELRGFPVIMKTPSEDVIIGILNAWEVTPKLAREKLMYRAYSFTIQRLGWEDFIDDTV